MNQDVVLPESLTSAFQYIRSQQARYVAALQDLVRIPSVTSDRHACESAAERLAGIAREAGLVTRSDRSLAAPPVIFVRGVPDAQGPVLVGYGHYDVKTAGDVAEWRYGPWSGDVHDGRIYGRGVVDNKSGCLAFIFAAEACLRTSGMPVDLRVVLEGEEETGSEHLEEWVLAHARDLGEGAGLFCLDGSVEASTGLPRVDLVGRGILYVELSLDTAETDVHSGRAVLAHNAAWRLLEALRTIKDVETDTVIIPGWADDLVPLDDDDAAYFAEKRAEFRDQDTRALYGLRQPGFPGGRTGIDLVRALYMEPTCTICGFWSGNVEPGVLMTIVPRKATAKLDFRLPPKLDAPRQLEKLKHHLIRSGYADIDVKVLSARPHTWYTGRRAAVVAAIRQAGLDAFGQQEPRSSTVPTAEGVFAHHLGFHPVLTGFGNADARIHAPDENLVLEHYIRGIQYAAAIYHRYGAMGGAGRVG